MIAGDGIGTEVVPEGLRSLETVAKRFDINLHFDHFDFSSYDYYARHGDMLPEDWKQQIGGHDAIFFGAVGWQRIRVRAKNCRRPGPARDVIRIGRSPL